MRIQNNVTAINSHRMYTINSGALAKDVEKLSSGYRINRAGDDAAGLAISEKMRAQIRGLTMASKNSLDAISLIQTAEGALQSSHNILQRMRELAVQSASDTNETSIDRNALNLEFQQLKTEIDDIANKTVFNDQKLIDGTFSKNNISTAADAALNGVKSAWVGTSMVSKTQFTTEFEVSVANKVIQASVKEQKGSAEDGSAPSQNMILTAEGVSVEIKGTVVGHTTISKGDDSLNGVWQLGFDSTSKMFTATNQSNGQVLSAAATAVQNQASFTIDFGNGIKVQMKSEGANFTVNSVNDYSGLSGAFIIKGSVSKQEEVKASFMTVGTDTVRLYDGQTVVAFQNSDVSIQLKKAWNTSTDAPGGDAGLAWSAKITASRVENKNLVIQTGANQGDETAISIDRMNANALGIKYASISGRLEASSAITQVNGALNIISTQRATLGALQNRLEFKISNLDTSAENLQAAESRIRDTDMAKQMTSFMKNNILFQASTAMLAQANSLPQGVLQLLG